MVFVELRCLLVQVLVHWSQKIFNMLARNGWNCDACVEVLIICQHRQLHIEIGLLHVTAAEVCVLVIGLQSAIK